MSKRRATAVARPRLSVHAEGAVTTRQPGTPTAVAAGSRCVAVGSEVLCTFMVQSKLSANDFVPMIARSPDGGVTWRDERPMWPALRDAWSMFGSISAGRNGALMFFGSRCGVRSRGASEWCAATQGMRQNELFWSRSTDGGRSWQPPAPIPMQIPGAAEAAGPMCVTREGRWLVCYGPYNTFDPTLEVDRGQLALMSSADRGRTWAYQPLMRYAEPDSASAEAWVIELGDGRLLATCWHVDLTGQQAYPNPYALSSDGGRTWRGPRSTGIMGHTTALAALPDGRAAMAYVRRDPGHAGVHLAIADPREDDFGLVADQHVWHAERATQHDGAAEHDNWADFTFGEPSALPLPDGALLVTFWCIEPGFRGIRWLRVGMDRGADDTRPA